MSIPDFQTVMRPLLEHLSDGQERTNSDTVEALSRRFGLTESELAELIPSGRQPLFYNRVAWAKTHLKAAGCVESPARGVYRITERGRRVLAEEPERVDLRQLRQFPEYREFRQPKPDAPRADDVGESTLTPEEHLEYGYRMIREGLKVELLQLVKDPAMRDSDTLTGRGLPHLASAFVGAVGPESASIPEELDHAYA